MVPTSSFGPPCCTGGGPTGRTDSVTFSPAQTRFWADPQGARPGEINHHDGGRGVYFQDPSGHYLEIITRPYGSGG
jgi:hypothetical protein